MVSQGKIRVALYSHDTFGLGHLSRCLKIYRALARRLGPLEGLFLTGSPWAHLFDIPRGARLVRLPPVVKSGAGAYRSRDAAAPLDQLLAERRRRIELALEGFRADLLIVDNVPSGLHREMLPVLRARHRAGSLRTVLALRDILDEPAAVEAEWQESGADEVLETLYDEIWVFGEAEDVERLGIGCLARLYGKVVPCGRLGMDGPLPAPGAIGSSLKVLVTGGGGGDAEALVNNYLSMLASIRPAVESRIVLGPDYPGRLPRVNGSSNVSMARFQPRLAATMQSADVVVAMAGYNTVDELLATGRRAVLVPRVQPRQEQLLRARRLGDREQAIALHPERLAPARLWAAIEEAMAMPRPEAVVPAGGEQAAERAASLLGFVAPRSEGADS